MPKRKRITKKAEKDKQEDKKPEATEPEIEKTQNPEEKKCSQEKDKHINDELAKFKEVDEFNLEEIEITETPTKTKPKTKPKTPEGLDISFEIRSPSGESKQSLTSIRRTVEGTFITPKKNHNKLIVAENNCQTPEEEAFTPRTNFSKLTTPSTEKRRAVARNILKSPAAVKSLEYERELSFIAYESPQREAKLSKKPAKELPEKKPKESTSPTTKTKPKTKKLKTKK